MEARARFRRGRAAVASVLVLAVAAPPSGAAEPLITFIRADGGDTTSETYTRVYTMRQDGTQVFEVTHDPAEALGISYVAWRPDRKAILFRGDPLELVRPNGTDRRALEKFTRPSADSPSYRSDGKRIVFTTNNLDGENTRYAIATIKADGSGYHRLTKFKLNAQDPAYSPKGESIAFVRSNQIWRMRADGTHRRRVTDESGGAATPDWSPDGERIAYANRNALFTIRPDGTGRKRIVNGADLNLVTGFLPAVENPAWSPSGHRIVFSDNGALYSVKPSGKGVLRLTAPTGNQSDMRPDW